MSGDEKGGDSEVSEDVDALILDYLIFQALEALLKELGHNLQHSAAPTFSSRVDPLELLGGFLSIFQSLHTALPPDPDVELRLRLLKFTAVFTRRKPSSRPPVLRNGGRNSFNPESNAGQLADPIAHVDNTDDTADRMITEHTVNAVKDEAFSQATKYPYQAAMPSISLLETLPDFMALSAAQNVRQESTSITETWMKLAAGYMAHAVIEQCLVYKSARTDLIHEAFRWGFDEDCSAEAGTDAFLTNMMFFDEVVEDANALWEATRREHMQVFMPPEGIGLADHAQHLLDSDFPIAEFEQCMIEFLTITHRSLSRPLLTQVESTAVNSMSSNQSRAFRAKVGIHDRF